MMLMIRRLSVPNPTAREGASPVGQDKSLIGLRSELFRLTRII